MQLYIPLPSWKRHFTHKRELPLNRSRQTDVSWHGQTHPVAGFRTAWWRRQGSDADGFGSQACTAVVSSSLFLVLYYARVGSPGQWNSHHSPNIVSKCDVLLIILRKNFSGMAVKSDNTTLKHVVGEQAPGTLQVAVCGMCHSRSPTDRPRWPGASPPTAAHTVKVSVAQSCRTLRTPWTVASVHGILQARILE